jgi:hypothetical protein
VLVNKWEGRPDDAVTNTPDEGIVVKFHAAFGGPVSPVSANICTCSSMGRASTSPRSSGTELRSPALARPCRTIVYFSVHQG